MASHKILAAICLCVGLSDGQQDSATTQVPILRFLDTQNQDGSYTYGYETGDGTYKIETRFPDGKVKGKYGFYDPEGVLREASYGASSSGGFEPQIDGVVLPPPQSVSTLENEIIQESSSLSKQSRLATKQEGQIKIVNGRRAVVKKRLKLRPQQKLRVLKARPTESLGDKNLKARQVQLKQLEEHRRQLLLLQQENRGRSFPEQKSQTGRYFPAIQQQESLRTVQATSNFISHPYVSGLDLSRGSYSISY